MKDGSRKAGSARRAVAGVVVACAVAVLVACALNPALFARLGGQAELQLPAAAHVPDGSDGQAWLDAVPAPPVAASDMPDPAGAPSVQLNGGEPYFDVAEFPAQSFEAYSALDSRGRCGPCAALVGPETMPLEERGEIGEVRPTGWRLAKYPWIDGRYLYNRCHLLGYQLTGENANERNLVTGTRYLNVQGMQPYEDQVASYVRRTGGHVLYRVTPLFQGDEPLARGVVMEALSVEDGGAGVRFCAFCPNVQPGVVIDYATGESASDGTMEVVLEELQGQDASGDGSAQATRGQAVAVPAGCTYVANANSGKFHLPTCPAVQDMSARNARFLDGTREEAVAAGYEPCRVCNP